MQAAVSSNGAAPPDASANGSLPAAHLNGDHPAADDPELSIVVPVWSRTPELAEMAARTIERVWEVARIPTEVIVIDNGSPFERPIRRAGAPLPGRTVVSRLPGTPGSRLARAT